MKMRLGLEWFLNPDHLPLLIGLERGWFKEAGIELELIEPREHLDALDAIESGDMDVAITEPIHLVEDVAGGREAIGFARFLHTNGGVMFLRGTGIERPRDMVGKRIQYPGAPGPGGPAIVATMIEADGGSCDAKDFERVNNGFHHTDALAEGKADVATLAFYNFELVDARHRGLDADFFALKDWGVPDFCQLILITTPSRMAEIEEPLRALVRVIRRGIDFVKQRPEEARAIYFKRTETDPEEALGRAIFEATAACFTHDLAVAPSYWTSLSSWSKERGLIEREVEAKELWTDELHAGE